MRQKQLPRLSLDLLRGFRAAARYLSFTRAATELCVTQSAISHQVKTLESQLGGPLFTRVNRTLRLTQAGEQLYRAADESLALIDATAERIAGAARGLSITTSVPLASLWLGPRLPDFARRFPDIGLRVVASNDNLDIGREHIDIAIRFAPVGTTPPSDQKLFDVELFPVCSPALIAARPLASLADLSNHVLLDLETVRNGRPWFDWQQWMDARGMRGLKSAGLLRFSHYDQAIAAAIAGSGVAMGKWPHLAGQLHQGALIAPLGAAGMAQLGHYCVIVAGAASREFAETFLAWLHAEADQDIKQRDRAAGKRRVVARSSGRRKSRPEQS